MSSCAKPNKKKREMKYGKLERAFRKAGYNMTTFAREIGVNKSTVSDWCMGKYCPDDENLKKIVDTLNKFQVKNGEELYDIPYFRGDFETKNIGNYEIFKQLGILDEGIEGLKNLKKQLEVYANCNDPMLQSMSATYENGFNYTDVVSHIIGDVNLWQTILYETERVMNWHLSENYRNRFELLLNEEESGCKYPAQIEVKDISNQIISKAISKSFNEYISDKLKKLNIEELTADEHTIKLFMNLKNNKK